MHDMNDLTRLLVSAVLVDARGKACPAPIIELARALKTGAPAVELWADDPAAWGDLHAFCQATGHRLDGRAPEGRLLQAVIRHKATE
jgi:TusA-related sulfurtransferase